METISSAFLAECQAALIAVNGYFVQSRECGLCGAETDEDNDLRHDAECPLAPLFNHDGESESE